MSRIDFTTKPGEYTYRQGEHGKEAWGVIKSGATSERSPSAQRSAGGDDRQPGDHGGHLIAHSHGGRNDETNLDAQNANVNQIGQRGVERELSALEKNPNNVAFEHVQNYNRTGVDRPDATMITSAVLDKTTGNIDVQYHSFQNASYAEQDEWNKTAVENTEYDPRQEIGMTPEDRALANEYAEEFDPDDGLGKGTTTFLDPASEPITGDLVNTTDGLDDGFSGDNGMDGGLSADTGMDDGFSAGTGMDDGFSEGTGLDDGFSSTPSLSSETSPGDFSGSDHDKSAEGNGSDNSGRDNDRGGIDMD